MRVTAARPSCQFAGRSDQNMCQAFVNMMIIISSDHDSSISALLRAQFNNPLHVAYCILQVLLRLGADCEVLDEEWMTAEEEAQEMGENECVLLLRDHHASLQEEVTRTCVRHL